MTMKKLSDFLGDLNGKYAPELKKAREGVSGSYDGPPLPLNLEYRVETVAAEYKPSASGNMQIAVTYEIQQPEEFAGRRMQEYYQPEATHEVSQRKFVEVIGALGVDFAGLTNDWNEFANRFVGHTAVVALRVWGEADDRFGVRWINLDRGQVLKTNVQPPKPKKDHTSSLRGDVSIQKPPAAPPTPPQESPQQEEAQAPASTPLPGTNRPPGGPALPAGLR